MDVLAAENLPANQDFVWVCLPQRNTQRIKTLSKEGDRTSYNRRPPRRTEPANRDKHHNNRETSTQRDSVKGPHNLQWNWLCAGNDNVPWVRNNCSKAKVIDWFVWMKRIMKALLLRLTEPTRHENNSIVERLMWTRKLSPEHLLKKFFSHERTALRRVLCDGQTKSWKLSRMDVQDQRSKISDTQDNTHLSQQYEMLQQCPDWCSDCKQPAGIWLSSGWNQPNFLKHCTKNDIMCPKSPRESSWHIVTSITWSPLMRIWNAPTVSWLVWLLQTSWILAQLWM
jgi:hypothetical protein